MHAHNNNLHPLSPFTGTHWIPSDTLLAISMNDRGALVDEVHFSLAHTSNERLDMLWNRFTRCAFAATTTFVIGDNKVVEWTVEHRVVAIGV